MPLNPAIAASVQPFSSPDPFSTLQGIMQYRGMQEDQKYRQARTRALMQAEEEDRVFQDVVQQHTRASGVADWDKVVNRLDALGYANKGLEVRKKVEEIREQEFKNDKSRVDAAKATLELAGGLVEAMTTELAGVENPQLQQQVFQKWKGQIAKTAGGNIAEMLGERYDPKTIAGVLEMRGSAADSIARQRLALDKMAEARAADKAGQDATNLYISSYTNGMSAATNADEWLRLRQKFDSQGVPDAVMDMLPLEWAPQNRALAERLAMDAKDRVAAGQTAKRDAETKRHNIATEEDADLNRGLRDREIKVSEGEAQKLTPQALDAEATKYALTGQLTTFGQGSGARSQRTAIINRASELYPKLDLASNRGAYIANQASLTQMTKNLDAVQAFEATTKKNLEVFLEQAGKITDTGSPYLNKPLRDFNERFLGDTNQTAYKTALRTVVPEIARILTQPNLTGVLSDTARGEINQLMKEDATLAQTKKAAEILVRDMNNRKSELTAQRDGIQKRMSASSLSGDDTSTATPAPGGTTTKRAKQGDTWYDVTVDASGNVVSAKKSARQ